jgi:hypothetical protein
MLKNRFPQSVREQWTFWNDCMVCGKNNWDTLHHIISPTVRGYKSGKHNKSVLNSCPIHNEGCHLYNEAYLHDPENITMLLRKVLRIVVVNHGIKLKPIDREFIYIYRDLYEN